MSVKVPTNEGWDLAEVFPHKVRSYFMDDGSDDGVGAACCHHLHREFVERTEGTGEFEATVCPKCDKDLNNGKVPAFSVARGAWT